MSFFIIKIIDFLSPFTFKWNYFFLIQFSYMITKPNLFAFSEIVDWAVAVQPQLAVIRREKGAWSCSLTC